MGSASHLRSSDYDVRRLDVKEWLPEARSCVERWHYSGGGSNTATDLHGLFFRGGTHILGIAWWLPTTKVAAQSVAGDDWRRCVALSRLAINPGVPTNGCSFLLGRSERILRDEGRWTTLVTWADEGEGHTGAIYRACNWEYMGRTKGAYRYRHPDGRLMSKKRGPRTFSHQEMVDAGYEVEGPFPKHKFRKVL